MRWRRPARPCFTEQAFLKPGLWAPLASLALPSSLEPFLALSGTGHLR